MRPTGGDTAARPFPRQLAGTRRGGVHSGSLRIDGIADIFASMTLEMNRGLVTRRHSKGDLFLTVVAPGFAPAEVSLTGLVSGRERTLPPITLEGPP
jgi:hypothetical protein